MRILALHGSGTNAGILEAQLTVVKAQLPPHWEWVFAQAEHLCDASPGVEIWPGPYRNYFTVPCLEAMADTYQWLHEVIEDEGPFDGVVGFSEGGALAAGALIHQQLEDPNATPLFRFAIFASSALPWAANRELGIDVTPMMYQPVEVPADLSMIKSQCAELSKKSLKELRQVDVSGLIPCLSDQVTEYQRRPYRKEDYEARKIHPEIDSIRISIPTGHALCKTDYVYERGLKLRDMCDPKYALSVEHKAGHAVPRGMSEAKALKEMIEKTAAKANFSI